MTCNCGKPTRDDAYVCDDCLDLLARTLGDVPALLEEVDITITRQQAAGQHGTSTARPAERPLPWNEKAAEALRALHSTLVGWVRFCDEEQVRSRDPRDGLPEDDTADLARWLMWRVDGLAFHELGHDAVDQIADAAAQCWRIVFWKRRNRIYLGTCGKVAEHDGEPGDPCPGEVYADEGSVYGVCEDTTEHIHSVTERQAELTRRLDDTLGTAAEIAGMTVYLGLDADRETVRKRINQWHTRARIRPAQHSPAGDPMFRYGEVRALLYATFATREAS